MGSPLLEKTLDFSHSFGIMVLPPELYEQMMEVMQKKSRASGVSHRDF